MTTTWTKEGKVWTDKYHPIIPAWDHGRKSKKKPKK